MRRIVVTGTDTGVGKTYATAALAQALLPEEAPDSPPGWLRTDQRLSFRRCLAAVRRFGGAILADPVGTGKTYVGLATASTLARGQSVVALVPAALRSQWEEAAEKTAEAAPPAPRRASRTQAVR